MPVWEPYVREFVKTNNGQMKERTYTRSVCTYLKTKGVNVECPDPVNFVMVALGYKLEKNSKSTWCRRGSGAVTESVDTVSRVMSDV